MDSLKISGTLDSLEAVGQYVMAAAAEAGLSKSSAYKLRLAVDEIVTNIVIHGYSETGTSGDMDLHVDVENGALVLTVEDTAGAFDPFSLAPPDDLTKPLEERAIGGLGVFLAIESVDEFKYERVGDRNRNMFVVKLSMEPAAVPEAKAPAVPEVKATEPIIPPPPATRVIIVDDDRLSRQAMSKMLTEQNYDVATAETFDETSRALQQKPTDAILLNLKQSRENPFQMLKMLRDEKSLVDSAIIAVASADATAGTARALEMGADDFILTPTHAALLHTRITASVNSRRMEQQLAQGVLELQRTEHERGVIDKIERDVQIARQIQLSFLPSKLPEPQGWEIAGRFRPARQVAGDWYDAFYLEQIRRVGLVVADVCDKGVGPAMFMALMRSLVRAFAQRPPAWIPPSLSLLDEPPSLAVGRRRAAPTAGSMALKSAMEQTNNYIAKNHGDTGMFATVFFGILDPATGLLQYINGGHEPPMIIGPDGIKNRLQPTGMAIGIMEDSEFVIESVQLAPGDILLAYTDGVTDARNPDREFFTEANLISLVNRPAPTANALVDRIMDSLQAHIADADQFDDITMLAVRRAAS